VDKRNKVDRMKDQEKSAVAWLRSFPTMLADNLVRINAVATEEPQVAFLGTADPSTGRQGRIPRAGLF
jgi:hypothetical protein